MTPSGSPSSTSPCQVTRGWFASIALLLVAPCSGLAGARADCDVPAFELVWSYPADGDSDVPTNTELWFLTTQWGIEPTVKFEGKRVALEPGGVASSHRAAPGPLRPHHTYSLVVTPPAGDASSQRYEIQFTTGEDPATAPAAPEERSVEWSNNDPSGCPEVVSTQDCFDTGQDMYMRQGVSQPAPGTVAWLVSGSASTLWPIRCGDPTLFVTGGPRSPRRCFKVRALGAGGVLGDEMDTCEDHASDRSGVDCTLAPARRDSAAASAGWLVTGLLAWRLFRRARPRHGA